MWELVIFFKNFCQKKNPDFISFYYFFKMIYSILFLYIEYYSFIYQRIKYQSLGINRLTPMINNVRDIINISPIIKKIYIISEWYKDIIGTVSPKKNHYHQIIVNNKKWLLQWTW